MSSLARNWLLCWVCGSVLLTVSGTARAEDARQSTQRALSAFDDAVSAAAARDSERATRLYREAADGFETAIRTNGRSAGLEYNLGNTYFRLGDLGRAIVHFRRAAVLAPRDGRIAANLAYARERVTPKPATSGEQRLLQRLAFWRVLLSPMGQFIGALTFSVAGWGLLITWLWKRRQVIATLGIVAAISGALFSAALLWDLRESAELPAGVIVGGEQTLQLGRGEGTGPALDRPLGPGVELRIITERAGWCEVRLSDGHGGWLPASAVERI